MSLDIKADLVPILEFSITLFNRDKVLMLASQKNKYIGTRINYISLGLFTVIQQTL